MRKAIGAVLCFFVLWPAAAAGAAAKEESRPSVLILLASHGAPGAPGEPGADFDANEVIPLLETHLKKGEKRKVVVWFENGLPGRLKTDPVSNREYFAEAAQAANLESTRALYYYMLPGGAKSADVAKIDAGLSQLFEASIQAEGVSNEDLSRLLKSDLKIQTWFRTKRPGIQIEAKTEKPSFLAWREFFKASLFEYAFQAAIRRPDAKQAIDTQFYRLAHMNQHIKMRDTNLAIAIRDRMQEGKTLHVVIRGSAHVFLKQKLEDLGIAAAEYRVKPLEDERPEVHFLNEYDPAPEDLEKGGVRVGEMRREVTRIIPFQFTEEYLTNHGKTFDNTAYARTVRKLSEDELTDWVELFRANPGVPVFKRTAEWLTTKRKTSFNTLN